MTWTRALKICFMNSLVRRRMWTLLLKLRHSMVPDCTAGSSDLFIDAACQPYARQGYFDWESLLEASQAALDDADLIEMMDTLERNFKKINTTLWLCRVSSPLINLDPFDLDAEIHPIKERLFASLPQSLDGLWVKIHCLLPVVGHDGGCTRCSTSRDAFS